MAEVYHTSHGYCNNRQTVLNLQSKGIECNHLKRYILAHKCDACDAAPDCRHHKVRATTKAKHKARSASNTIAPLPATVAACDLQNSLVDNCDLDLEFSTITDAIDPNVTITESLALFFQHTSKNPCDYLDIDHMRNMSDTTHEPTENSAMLPPRAFSENSTVIDDGANLKTNTAPHFSPPGTDLRMDWGDACSLGFLPDLNRYFLLVMDKGTEYFVSFPTKTRSSPLALLKQFVTLTGRKIRYLRIDGAKEFQSAEIKTYCAENDVVLQLVVA